MPPPYDPVHKCIYCGAISYRPEGGKLSDEHIIPAAMNDDLVLPQASCWDLSVMLRSLHKEVRPSGSKMIILMKRELGE